MRFALSPDKESACPRSRFTTPRRWASRSGNTRRSHASRPPNSCSSPARWRRRRAAPAWARTTSTRNAGRSLPTSRRRSNRRTPASPTLSSSRPISCIRRTSQDSWRSGCVSFRASFRTACIPQHAPDRGSAGAGAIPDRGAHRRCFVGRAIRRDRRPLGWSPKRAVLGLPITGMKPMPVHLEPGPDTVHWGYFDARLSPRIAIDSGERVTISSVSGGPELMPGPPLIVPPALPAIHAKVPRQLGPHMLTGPVAVKGAKPGQVLQVEIEAIDVLYDWGYNAVRPLAGALPDDFAENRHIHVVLDRARNSWRLPWGQEVPLAPFFGVMGTAPPPAWGMISTAPPRRNGGNLDNKELVAGTTLYLPIFVEDALFSVGDGHGVQGDGEVCITAVETGLTGTFRLTVRDDMRLEWPMAETPTHMITMAFDPDLDDCVVIALRQMLDLICARAGLDRYQAYSLASLTADLRVTQVVNGNKGIHVMIDKRYLTRAR